MSKVEMAVLSTPAKTLHIPGKLTNSTECMKVAETLLLPSQWWEEGGEETQVISVQ